MKTILINILLVIIGLITLELIFGEWLIDNRLFLTRIPRDVQISFPVSHLYQSPTNAIYTRDTFGLRGDYPSLDQIDILTVGGSTTDQRFIDDSLTWQTYISRQLSSETGRSFSVVNAGVDGQTTFGHIANFEHWFSYIPNLKPKFILFYIGLNDKWAASPNGKFDDAVKPDQNASLNLRKIILSKSALRNAWINLTGLITIKGKPGHSVEDWSSTYQVTVDNNAKISEQDALLLDAYKKRVARLIVLTREIGAKAIIVNQKSMLHTTKGNSIEVNVLEGWDEDYSVRLAILEHNFAKATLETCTEFKAICMDLSNDLANQLSEKHFYDLDHNNPAGTKLVGEYMAERISQALGTGDED